ncbi:MAG: hypothetical protein ACKVHP_09550 [Verrucomicrobiales bacterium]
MGRHGVLAGIKVLPNIFRIATPPHSGVWTFLTEIVAERDSDLLPQFIDRIENATNQLHVLLRGWLWLFYFVVTHKLNTNSTFTLNWKPAGRFPFKCP